MRIPDRPSAFTSDSARDKYYVAYDRVLGELWPVPVEAVDVETRAGSVRILRAGPAEGDPVVLLAGSGGNALAWDRYIEPLARTRPVLAVDPLGEPGRSVQTRPLATGAEVGGWLTDVLAAVGAERAHVVGSSYGAWTATEQQLSEGGRVAALTLVDPVGFAPLTGRFYRWVIVGGMAAMLPRALRRRLAGVVGNGALREDVLMKLVLAGRSFRRRLPIPPAYTDEQVRELSESAPIQVQVLLGARSALHDPQAVTARLAEIAPSWRVEIIPDTGHALPVEAPDLVIDRILAFPDQARIGSARPEHSATHK